MFEHIMLAASCISWHACKLIEWELVCLYLLNHTVAITTSYCRLAFGYILTSAMQSICEAKLSNRKLLV